MKKKYLLLILCCAFFLGTSIYGSSSGHLMQTAEKVNAMTEEEKDEFLISKGFTLDDIKKLDDKNLAVVNIMAKNLSIEEIIEIYNIDGSTTNANVIDYDAFFSSNNVPIEKYQQLTEQQKQSIYHQTINYNLDSQKVQIMVDDKVLDDRDDSDDSDTSNSITSKSRSEIVPFKVTINGQVIDNEYSEYPFMLYKDVTYFPLTWNMNRFMGLESDYNNYTFTIQTAGEFAEYEPYTRTTPNDMNVQYYIYIPTYTIIINGETINNTEEEYPFFTLKGITYFPMTWDNMVNRFNFSSEFSEENGLVITSN